MVLFVVCELFPTLLHFSARFGLEKLTSQLLDCPGGDLACDIRNVQDFTPADIAENVGHKEINNMLKGYMVSQIILNYNLNFNIFMF